MPSKFRRALSLYSRMHPLTAARILHALFQSKVLKRPLLKYMDVSIDYACNMDCKHCFQGTWKREGTKLDLVDYERIIREAKSIGLLHANIQGGEPLVVKQLPEIARLFSSNHIWTSITTNGYLVTPEWITKLKAAGVRQLITSIDSLDAAEHDGFRGRQGAHTRAMDALRMAHEGGLAVSVNVSISRQSFGDPRQVALLKWLRENRIPYNPIIATPAGNWSGQYDVMLTPEQIRKLGVETAEDKLGVRDLNASWVHEGCPAMLETIYLTPYGEVLPCPFIHISMGNVRERSLAEIWRWAVRERLHGGYHDKCWIGENLAFAKTMHQVAGPGTRLPVSVHAPGVLAALQRFWGSSSSVAEEAPVEAVCDAEAPRAASPSRSRALPVLSHV